MARKRKGKKTSGKHSKHSQERYKTKGTKQGRKNKVDDFDSLLDRGETCLHNGQEDKILEAVDSIEEHYHLLKAGQRIRYNSLRAYGFLNYGKYLDAEKVVQRLMDDTNNDSLDAFYVLAFSHLSMREYDLAAEAAEKYLSLYSKETADEKTNYYAATSAHLSQVHNFLGSIRQTQGESKEAVKSYERAIEADKRNHLPYLNLAKLYDKAEKLELAREAVQRGISNCTQVQELRLLAESLERGATVSACMIVKDEEELLPGCLESIRDWVDEIIIVDTGSTDSTVEIAKSYGAKIFHQEWEGNFSKHRNYSMDKATSDWIFIIDADERFNTEDVKILLRGINKKDCQIISVNVFNYSGKFNERVTSLASTRLFRRELNLRYEGIVHNQLVIDSSEPIVRTKARIKHFGYGLSEEKMAAKAKRTTDLLEKQLKENPNNAYACFNYAQVLLGQDLAEHQNNPPRIIEAASRAVELTNPDTGSRGDRHIHLMALGQLALINFILADNDSAEKYALRSLEIKPDYLDSIMVLGNIYLRRNGFDKAEQYFNRYLKAQAQLTETFEADEIMLMHPESFQHAYYGLGLVAEYRRDWEKAAEYLRKTLEYNPELLDANARLGRVYLEQKRYDDAEVFFKKQLEINDSAHRAAIGLACVYQNEGKEKEVKQWLDKALNMLPVDHPALVEYAIMVEDVGLSEHAGKFIDKIGVPDDDMPVEKKRSIAECSFRLGQYGKAADFYEDIVQNETPDAALLNDLAGCYYKIEDYSKAEEYYQQATGMPQVIAISFRNLGLSRIKLKKNQQAALALEKYLEMAPDQYEIVSLLGDLYFQIQDFNRAMLFYERFLKMDPGNAQVMFGLSECYLLMGHKGSALIGYQKVLQIAPEFKPARERMTQIQEIVHKA